MAKKTTKKLPKTPHPKGKNLRSQLWFDNPENPGMTALKLNKYDSYFEFAFENYTALGYGDALPVDGNRLIGPITALNGVLLIGWSVAVIFEVMRMAELSFGIRREPRR